MNKKELCIITPVKNWVKSIQAAAYNGARTVVKTLHGILEIRENLLRVLVGLDDAGFDDTRYRCDILVRE